MQGLPLSLSLRVSIGFSSLFAPLVLTQGKKIESSQIYGRISIQLNRSTDIASFELISVSDTQICLKVKQVFLKTENLLAGEIKMSDVQDTLGSYKVQIEVVMGAFHMPLSQVLALSPGQLIEYHHDVHEEARLLVDGYEIAKARFVSEGKEGLEITSITYSEREESSNISQDSEETNTDSRRVIERETITMEGNCS